MNMKRGSLAQLNNQCVALAPKEHEAHTAVEATLREIREIFHRSGSLSSQHEVLGEIAKLLFAHVSSIDAGERGARYREEYPARTIPANALRLFVAKSLKRSLPESMSFELSSSDLDLQLRLNEDRVGLELIDCFARNANREQFIQARTTGQLDIMNHAFGQFLAHTFVDEKELGQYLTPPAVVRTMVRLGLDSLDGNTLEAMYSPNQDQNPGVILDPSCGVGSFLAETLRVLYEQAKNRMRQEDLHRWATSTLKNNIIGIDIGIDKSERMIRLATANLALFGAPATNLHLANSLVRGGTDGELSQTLNGRAILILTNPPFGATFSSTDLSGYQMAGYQMAQGENNQPRKSVDSEVLFLERYLEVWPESHWPGFALRQTGVL